MARRGTYGWDSNGTPEGKAGWFSMAAVGLQRHRVFIPWMSVLLESPHDEHVLNTQTKLVLLDVRDKQTKTSQLLPIRSLQSTLETGWQIITWKHWYYLLKRIKSIWRRAEQGTMSSI
jgi:hypothetical protein